MTDKNRFVDEMLTKEQLESVSGGTYGEYKDLRNLIFKFERKKNSDAEKLSSSGVEKWLKDKLDITATISTGFFLNFSDDAGKTNIYRDNGQKEYISHNAVIQKITEYFKPTIIK